MSELGTRLKTAREEKGFSLEEMQEKTKIQKRYLQAIEDGDYSQMPGEFYSRAFIKSYAEALDFDAEQLFAEHESELPKPKKAPADLPPRKSRTRSAPPEKKSGAKALLPSVLAIVFVVAAGLVIWLFNQDGDQAAPEGGNINNENNTAEVDDAVEETDESGEGNNTEGTPEDENDGENDGTPVDNENNNNDSVNNNSSNNNNNNGNENEDNGEAEEQNLSFDSADGIRYTYQLEGTEDVEIEVNFSGDSWLAVEDGSGDQVHEQTHSEGDTLSLEFSGEETIVFNMGNTSAAQIFVNGEELEYESGEVRQYIIIEQNA
ncbi:helix-turn-helix domain-containing protein [Alkalicoccus chagannorensis]|uniref:helix-turn-helix domain-containing protein n=2 Tax=Alkalicoccus chagannorensis TaxID=427072 RepID=UPI000415FB09|nr:helix-turn-helix domain-containing protein [Alkalicoccus chagannorensis]